ncbi:hypothetical protein D3C87_1823290 [compost metagenome]
MCRLQLIIVSHDIGTIGQQLIGLPQFNQVRQTFYIKTMTAGNSTLISALQQIELILCSTDLLFYFK